MDVLVKGIRYSYHIEPVAGQTKGAIGTEVRHLPPYDVQQKKVPQSQRQTATQTSTITSQIQDVLQTVAQSSHAVHSILPPPTEKKELQKTTTQTKEEQLSDNELTTSILGSVIESLPPRYLPYIATQYPRLKDEFGHSKAATNEKKPRKNSKRQTDSIPEMVNIAKSELLRAMQSYKTDYAAFIQYTGYGDLYDEIIPQLPQKQETQLASPGEDPKKSSFDSFTQKLIANQAFELYEIIANPFKEHISPVLDLAC